MRKLATVLGLLGLVATTALVPADGAGARLGAPVPPPTPTALEPDTLVAYGEWAGGGALVEVVELATGRRQVIEDTRGLAPADGAGAHADETGGEHSDEPGDAEVGAASTDPRCTNDGEYAYLTGDGASRYWHAIEDWNFDPDNVPTTVPNWKPEVQAANDVWQGTVNPCGLPDTIGWVSPPNWTDDDANVPKQGCQDNPSDGRNTVGFREYDNANFVAYACSFTASFGGQSWVVEGDVSFNTLLNFCEGCSEHYDIRAAALHEFGHILGLGHPCSFSNPDDPCDWEGPESEAVMFPSLVGHRTLSKADIQGAESLYPAEEGYEIDAVTLVNDAGNGQKLAPGHEYAMHVDLKNVGMQPWTVDGAQHVLSTLDQLPSQFAGADWVSTSRPSRVDQDRTNGPGNDNQTIVRDEVGRFTFKARISLSQEGQTPSIEDLGLLHDVGTPAFLAGDPISHAFDVGTYGAAFDDQLTVPVVVQGVETIDVWVDLENTGDAPWFASETLSLAASDGAGAPRCSVFAGSNWDGCATASYVDENVSRTLLPALPSTAPVLPGQIGRFKFRFSSPLDPGLIGQHNEVFESKLEDGRFLGAPTTIDLVVL